MTLADVKRHVLQERGGQEGSWPWTERFLDAADRQFGGRWRRVTLDGGAAGRIVLPPHAGEPCHGDRIALVPPVGATVEATAETLRRVRGAYASANPECWRRISTAADGPLSAVVLTTAPLEGDVHEALAADAATLYHLDGFHRLVGWAVGGRLSPNAAIHALVAG